MSAESDIVGVEKVIAVFGRWPSFHDMEVVSLFLDRRGETPPIIEAVILVWDYTGKTTPGGYYEQYKHSLIRFRFESVTKNEFGGLNEQNVLFSLDISRVNGEDGPQLCVKMHPVYGLGAEICASRIAIIDVSPATPRGEPVQG